MASLLCPECRGELRPEADGHLRCTAHGGRFQVLFHREARSASASPPPASEPWPAPPESQCAGHPGAPATELCMDCRAPMCGTCVFPMPDGQRVCPACAVKPGHRQPPVTAVPAAELGECALHPGQPALARCNTCGALMCPTCDFTLPGDQHACPKCVGAASGRGLSPKRRGMMLGAFALAACATLAFGILLVAAQSIQTESDAQAFGVVMMILVLVPSIAGAGLGFGALDQRRGNTLALWIAAAWNLLIVVGFLLMSLIGALSG